jgi:ATPase subunit of ABC transporter with duplicated ATPase domains
MALLAADQISIRFGGLVAVDGVSFAVEPGQIFTIIGPNGAGKTTLFRMLVGQEKPDTGTVKVGATVDVGYVDQNRDALDPEKTVFEEISGGHDTIELGKRTVNARSYVAKFNFMGPDQQKKVGTLSGGERNRVHLAKLLRGGANLLLLDEPTNDLDVDTLRSLEEGISSFAGSVVVITHDRWFLDRLATHIIAFEGDGYVHVCEGNFEVYERSRKERQGVAADEPHRFRHKKLQH